MKDCYKKLIKNATIVNEGKTFVGSVLIDSDYISAFFGELPDQEQQYKAMDLTAKCESYIDEKKMQVIDARGLYLIPGVIDTHVHFRDPGLTDKATMDSETQAAAAGGVTSFVDMPNTRPQTTTFEAMEQKLAYAKEHSRVNYGFFFGATNDNAGLLPLLDLHNPNHAACAEQVCGVKLFMGASTGNMLVDQPQALEKVFKNVPKDMLIVAHCEDSNQIAENTKTIQEVYGEDPDVSHHPQIRSAKACYDSTELAVELAKKYKARLHVAHISTERELALFTPDKLHYDFQFLDEGRFPTCIDYKRITCEACIPHIIFSDADYKRLGTLIKCNPAIKTALDRKAIRQALKEGRIDTVATDHAPHRLEDKQGGCIKAASGIPSIQFSLISMLERVHEGMFTWEEVTQWMSHNPATLLHLYKRGFLRPGYYADMVLVRPNCLHTVAEGEIRSKCHWSPFTGMTFHNEVAYTFCNGSIIYNEGEIRKGRACCLTQKQNVVINKIEDYYECLQEHINDVNFSY